MSLGFDAISEDPSCAIPTAGISANVGAWGWVGTLGTTSQLINATIGAWGWAGVGLCSFQMFIQATPGVLHRFQFDRSDIWPSPEAREWPFRRV